MLSNQGQAASVVSLLPPVDAADTAAATGSWIDVRDYEGDLVFTVQVGVVGGGQIVPAIQHASDDQGAGAATLTLNEGAFTTVTTSNDPLTQKRTANAKSTLGFVRFIGTVTTGPAQVGASMLAHPKYTS